VNGITFTNADVKPFYQDARKKAIAEAIEKAETIAQAANLKLGKIIEINENNDGYHLSPRLMSRAANVSDADTNFSAGELN
ncbi:MAG: SIMPL domain-containing protein, partial [Bartonella sp.]|nr:SIMPL domain-containing protein [Bartonella sp.]